MRTACRTHSSLMTGSMPGIAASTSETWLLGSPPNSVEAPENSFEFEVTWAWTSSPITILPVAGGAFYQFCVGRTHARSTPEQRRGDPLPFGLKRILRHRLAGLPVPVTGIAEIAFDTVQIGMDPCRVHGLDVLGDLVRLVPIALGGPPQARPTARRDRAPVPRPKDWL